MACNCKRKIELDKKYGTNEEMPFYKKAMSVVFKLVLMSALIVIGIVICPILFAFSLYKAFWGNKVIVLPKFLAKYMK